MEILNCKIHGGSGAALSSVEVVILLSLHDVFSISCLISSGSMPDLRDLLSVLEDMTYVFSSYFWPVAPYGCSKDTKPCAGVLTVPDSQDSGMVDNDSALTLKKEVRFRGWTEITECYPSTASGLVECEPCEDEDWLSRPNIRKTVGPRY